MYSAKCWGAEDQAALCTANSRMNYVAQVAVEAISSLQHHTGFSALCCFTTDTVLFSPTASLSSLSLYPCVLVLKPFVCFHFIVNSVPLNFSALQSGPIGTLHSVSTSLSICSLGHGASWEQIGLSSMRLNVSDVSPQTHKCSRKKTYILPIKYIIHRFQEIADTS